MSEELKPCPFCGGEAVLWSPHQYDFRIGCKDDCIPCKMEVYNEREDDCIKAWNTRTHPAPNDGDVQEALEALEALQDSAFLRPELQLSGNKVRHHTETIRAALSRPKEQSAAVRELASHSNNWLGYEVLGETLFFGRMRECGEKLYDIWYSVDMTGYTEAAKMDYITKATILMNAPPIQQAEGE